MCKAILRIREDLGPRAGLLDKNVPDRPSAMVAPAGSETAQSNTHQLCREDSPTKGLGDLCQSYDLVLHTRSQLRLKLDTCLYYNSHISDTI